VVKSVISHIFLHTNETGAKKSSLPHGVREYLRTEGAAGEGVPAPAGEGRDHRHKKIFARKDFLGRAKLAL